MDEKLENDKDRPNSILFGIKKYLTKLSSGSKIKLLVFVIFIAVVLVIYTNYGSENSDAKEITATNKTQNSYYVSSLDYCRQIETKLKKVLSNLNNVGEVEVMVTLDTSLELVFAESSDKTSNGLTENNGSYIVEVSTPIIIDSVNGEEPLIVKEILPKVKGVLIVCSNASDVATKLNIVQAVQSLLGINISNIQVLSGK